MAMPSDKLRHLMVGGSLGCAFGLIGPTWGIAAAVAAGIAKEVRDRYWASLPLWLPGWLRQPGTCDWWDALATVAGGVVGAGIASLAGL